MKLFTVQSVAQQFDLHLSQDDLQLCVVATVFIFEMHHLKVVVQYCGSYSGFSPPETNQYLQLSCVWVMTRSTDITVFDWDPLI